MRADDDLAIGDLAQGARILAGHSDHTTPLLGSLVSSSISMPSGGFSALRVLMGCRSRAWDSQSVLVHRCWSRVVEVLATPRRWCRSAFAADRSATL